MAHRQNIIVVSVAYRLGVFGYMHNEAFLSEDGVMGNFASLDQRAALQWVNQHIASIGGDPTDVTITGCSAGGQSVLVHLTSPQSWPYFQKALTFSAPIGLPYKTKEEVTPFYNQIIDIFSLLLLIVIVIRNSWYCAVNQISIMLIRLINLVAAHTVT